MFEIDKSVFYSPAVCTLQSKWAWVLLWEGQNSCLYKRNRWISAGLWCCCRVARVTIGFLVISYKKPFPIDCCSSGRVLVVLNVSRFRMMEGLCAHDSKEYRSLSYTGSRLRLDILKLLSPRIGEIIPTSSLSVGSLVSLPSSPALPQVHFQQVNLQD